MFISLSFTRMVQLLSECYYMPFRHCS